MESLLVPIPVNAPGVIEFYLQRDLIWWLLQGVTFAVPLLLLFTGLGAGIRTLCARIAGERGAVTLILCAAAYLTILVFATLPVAYWLDVAHRVAWERPASSPEAWLVERATGLLVQIAGAALVLWIPFILIRRFPRWWWLPAGALAVIAVSVGLTAEQIIVRPLTASIEPLADGPLRSKLEAMNERCGAFDVPIFVGGTGSMSAEVVGVGPTRRIYIARDLMDWVQDDITERQFLTVYAHELKHYRLDDNKIAFGLAAAVILALALLVQIGGGGAIRIWGRRFNFDSLGDPAALPLMLLIIAFSWTFGGQLIFNAVQRHVEVEADRFGLEVTRDNYAQAAFFVRPEMDLIPLKEYYWFAEVFRADHPSIAERIRFANAYRPWESGEPGAYDHICEPPDWALGERSRAGAR